MLRLSLTAILLLSAAVSVAVADSTPVVVSPESISDRDLWLRFEENADYLGFDAWKYYPGDDPSFADPSYDDSDWETTGTLLRKGQLPESGWNGIGWFRLRLDVDPALRGKVVALLIRQVGASEIYLDGELIRELGTVSPVAESETPVLVENRELFPLQFERGGIHVLAVRYSCDKALRRAVTMAGFDLLLRPWERAVADRESLIRSHTAYQAFFTGIPLALMLLHLLLFLFYPRARLNLYFAAFAGAAVVMTYGVFQIRFTTDPSRFLFLLNLFKVALVAMLATGARIVYAMFSPTLPKQFWVLAGLALLLALASPFVPEKSHALFAVVVVLEMLRVTIGAIVRRKEGAWIIGVGFVVFSLAFLVQAGLAFGILSTTITALRFPYVYGIIGLLISMSVYLARDFARISYNLEDANLELERYSQSLEGKVANRTRELQEKNVKLESTLDDLQRTQGQLVQSEKMASLAKLVAGVAHELNSPVGAIKSGHQTLVRGMDKLKTIFDTGEKENSVAVFNAMAGANEVLGQGVERVGTVVTSLKGFARLDQAEFQNTDLRECVESALVLLQSGIGSSITVVKDYGDVGAIYCAPAQLNQMFMHVLKHAVESIDGMGEIRIRMHQDDANVHIEIADTGSGMDGEQVRRAFDFDFRSSDSRVRLGFSLPTAYNIVQDHNGTIGLNSQPGEGTTVVIRLPKRAAGSS